MITIFILLILALGCFIIFDIGCKKKWDYDILYIIVIFIFFFSLLGGVLLGVYTGEETGQINALKGKYNYKMEIKYTKKDTIYVPTDTIYIKLH